MRFLIAPPFFAFSRNRVFHSYQVYALSPSIVWQLPLTMQSASDPTEAEPPDPQYRLTLPH